MTRLPRRVLWLGLAASLGLHLAVVGGLDWTPPHTGERPGALPADVLPVEMFFLPAPTPAPAQRAAAEPAPRAASLPAPAPADEPEPAESEPAESESVVSKPGEPALAEASAAPSLAAVQGLPPDAVTAQTADAPTGNANSAPATPPDTAALSAAAPVTPPAPPLNPLPARLDLRYQVRYGVATGEQTLVWVSRQNAYTLTSVAAATGLAGVFYRTRFVQTSQGKLTASGLAPDEFRDQRGDKRALARFDQANQTLHVDPAKGSPQNLAFEGVAQDALSLFFHLALTLRDDTREFAAPVFNGKKLREYAYRVVGDAELDTALGKLATIQITRTNSQDDGRFEAWFARDYYLLPVRVLRTDEQGNEAELTIAAITATP